ncbi:MAG: hypothetical protein LUF85_08545 [Bacteroides sp.]|nr:hypothetical protein [Bacteroides sp.]
MSCNCNKPHHYHYVPDKYVDISKAHPKHWEEVPALIGMDHCGKVFPVCKPEHELPEEDREKLDTLRMECKGEKALFDDGRYKPVYTKEETDGLIEKTISENGESIEAALEDAVFYDPENNISPRENIVLGNNRQLSGKTASGGRHNIVSVRPDNSLDSGDISLRYNIHSLSRPTVQTFNGTDYETNDIAYKKEVDTALAKAEEVQAGMSGFTERMEEAEATLEGLSTSVSDLQEKTEEGFTAVTQTLSQLDERVTQNSADIAIHSAEIESIRKDINETEHFRGYYGTIDEVLAISTPRTGDFAYNAETGTKWVYNGTTWANTHAPVPDQTVDASDSEPLMDGEAHPGTSNKYARGDHRHPNDATKADKTDLSDYLPLAGNSQASRMTGDQWISTGSKIRFSNSGNSYIGQDEDTHTTELCGNGAGGIDIVSANGTIKANGEELVTYNTNGYINAQGDILLKNNKKLFGTDTEGEVYNLAMINRWGIVDFGSASMPMNFTANSRPTVQLSGETGSEAHPIAFVEDIINFSESAQDQFDALSKSVSRNTSDIAVNSSDIESIFEKLAATDHFRGYYATTNEITSIADPQAGDFAFNAQTGTKWIYNGSTWADTEDMIPDQTVEAYEGLPLVDDEASAGSVNQYARGDHRHPTDTTRASAVELAQTNSKIDDLDEALDKFTATNEQEMSSMKEAIEDNTDKIISVLPRLSQVESTVEAQGELISQNSADIAVHGSDIESIFEKLTHTVHFRGYYATTNEITSISNPSTGDFAFNAQTGTKWIYNGSTWADTEDMIPDQTVEAYEGLPLVDDEASAGSVNQYARGDHRHPTDTTRASAVELAQATERINALDDTLEEFVTANEQEVNSIWDTIDSNVSDIASILPRVSEVESDLNAQKSDLERQNDLISKNTSDIVLNSSDIESILGRLAITEHFRGYYATTNEITSID